MRPARKRAAVVVILMAATFWAAQAWRPTVHLAALRPEMALEAMVPKAFGTWSLDDRMPVQLVSPDTQEMLSRLYNQTLSRTYVNRAGEHVMLSVAYGGDQSDGTRVHRPEVCYPAQGFEILSNRVVNQTLPSGSLPVRQLVARQGGRIEPLSYWVVVGERVALSGTQQKLTQLRYTMAGIIPDGALLRVSSIDPDIEHASRLQSRFIAELYQAIKPTDRPRLFGSPVDSH